MAGATEPLPDEYFADGVFAPEGAELLRSYTCVRCGHQAATWDAFRRHRAACNRDGPAPERDPLHSAPLAGVRALERWRRRRQRQQRSAWRPRRTPGPANR